ncbi:hypothetical protein GF337_17360 [candidate division KSB1 bacterium]|nr:hypothetical protein [candidate division KSB1 bacterium]
MYRQVIIFLLINTGIYAADIHIRINQLGFVPNDIKRAVVISHRNLDAEPFQLVGGYENEISYEGLLEKNPSRFENFEYCYVLDFSLFRKTGIYFIRVANAWSPPFEISNSIYNNLVDSLLLFFKVQRCGFTDPLLHEECHYFDATSLVIDGKKVDEQMDVTGGWHDAGDYTKFLNTTAYATYTLLFSYQFNPGKFYADRNANDIPDILDEAKIGLDWLLKLVYRKFSLVTQVQDLRDHAQGWRLPENDRLLWDRPAFVGIGKNLVGIYAATMALSYRIWREIPGYYSFAEHCLTMAENLYSIHQDVPDVDRSGTGAYQDSEYKGKLALGAIELYLATGRELFLKNAKKYAHAAGSDFWWSWGNINAYAHYRLAHIDTSFLKYIRENLLFFEKGMRVHAFGDAVRDTWGSNSTILGVALQAILWKKLTGATTFDKLAATQRDFILGKNQWGVSFIYNIGTNFSKNFHSQVAYFNNNRLPGAVAAGSISREKLEQYNIPYETPDQFAEFQTEDAIYRDDRMDYITNEPTITANATAVFVMAHYAAPR